MPRLNITEEEQLRNLNGVPTPSRPKVLQSDYIHKNEAPTDSCDDCSSWFDLSELDQVFVVQTEDDELLTFCDDYVCYHNYTN